MEISPSLKDSKDDLVLEVAVESKSKYIITFNKKYFKDSDKFGIEILTPQEFIKVRGLFIDILSILPAPNPSGN